MSKILPTTFRFSSTTSTPIFGGLSVLTMAFPEGDTFVILPNLCKHFPSRKHVADRNWGFKAFWVVYKAEEQLCVFAVERLLNGKCG